MRGRGGGKLLIEHKHAFDQHDHTVVLRALVWFCAIEHANRQLFDELGKITEESAAQRGAYALQEEIQEPTVEQP